MSKSKLSAFVRQPIAGRSQISLKRALYLPNVERFGRAETLVDMAAAAWRHGWDGFFIWDHLVFGDAETADPQVTVGAIAQASRGWRTRYRRALGSKFTIGVLVTPVPRRRGWKLAKEIATAASLLGADSDRQEVQLVWGVGLGVAHDYEVTGEPVSSTRERAALADCGIAQVRQLLGGEVPEFAPTPAPRVPVWSAMSWETGKRLHECPRGPLLRAAALDGVFPVPQPWPDPWESSAEIDAVRLGQLAAELDRISPLANSRSRDLVTCGRSVGLTGEQLAQRDDALTSVGVTWWLEVISPQDDPAGVSAMVAGATMA